MIFARGSRWLASCYSRYSETVAVHYVTYTFKLVTDVSFSNIKSSLCLISLQCSSQSDPTNANQQVQVLLEEKQQLETHNHQVCVQLTFS